MSEPFTGTDADLDALVADSHTTNPRPAALALTARYEELSDRLWDKDCATAQESAEYWRLHRAYRAWQAEHRPPFSGQEIEREPEQLVGLTLSLAGKDPVRWEGVTLEAFDDVHLILTGGEQVTRIFTDTPHRQPLGDGTCRVPRWDIARGFIHKDPVPEPHSG
ncbi:hypothetical protein ABZ897_50765 [Nonomuraea sp. NPDC046802]|uniref:hypothetical protein n=1 Tax=Nonomuraea sp. NPDC046802 TaxID=3154919 RepID=UPI0033FD9729